MAVLPQPKTAAQQPIAPGDVSLAGRYTDDAALKLVVQDADRAENFENTKQWVAGWPGAAILYQSPYMASTWEGTSIEKPNVPFYTVAKCTEALVPQIINGMFSDPVPFILQPRPGTSSDVARAVGAVISFQLGEIQFKQQIRYGVKNAVLFGTNIWKWGWESYPQRRKVYKPRSPAVVTKDNFGRNVEIHESDETLIDEVEIEEIVNQPFFHHMTNLKHVLVDPSLPVPDIRYAKYVIHRNYLTWNDLEKLRDRPGYDKLPSKEALLALFFPPVEPVETAPLEISLANPLWDMRAQPRYEKATADVMEQPLEVLERWDNQKVIVVLNRKIVICNDLNPYGRIPFLSIGFWDVPESFFGLGLGKIIGSEQRLQQGIMNTWLQGVALNLHGVYVRSDGQNAQSQNIRISPGKVINLGNKDGLKPLERLPAVPEALEALSLSQQRADDVSGSGENAMSQIGAGRRTTGQANLIAGGANSRPQDFVEKLADQVVIPFLYALQEMNASSLLPTKTLRKILSEELQVAWKGNIFDFLNARVRFDILAASKMQARRNMAQAIPIMIQFLSSAPIQEALATQGKKVDVAELIKMMFDVSDWKNEQSVILDMTPEDQQRMMAMNPGVQKAQMQQQQQQQQFQNQSSLIDQKEIARGGQLVLRQALMKAEEPEAVTGVPGGPGFGSNS